MLTQALLFLLFAVRFTRGQIYEDCQPNYLVEKDNAYGGVAFTASDEASCRNKCDAEASCIGFDFNTVQNTCLITSDITATGSSTTGVNHYKKRRACPFKTTSERCFFEYQGEKTISAAVGPLRGSDRTLNDCLGACMDIQACKAAVYVTATKECKLFFSSNDLANSDMSDQTGSAVYKMTTCNQVPLDGSCTESYTKLANYGMSNGQFVPDNNTQADCEETCTASSDCIAYDFNIGSSACYLHTDAKNSVVSKAGVDNYRKSKECQANLKVCTYESFGKYIPAASYANTAVQGVLSLTECIAACNQDPNCVGVIFNTVYNDGCFKYVNTTSQTAFSDKANLRQVTDGQTGFRRVECGEATTSATPTTSGTGSCAEKYREFPKKKVVGAISNGANTIDGCKSACTADRTCWGFDFNTADSSCWLFASPSTVSPYSTPEDSAVQTETHYEKYKECGSCQYNVYPNTKSTQSVLKSSYNTEESCLSACTNDATCQGVDYELTTNKCYFFTSSQSASTVQTDNNFNQYRTAASCSVGTTCSFDNFKYYPGKKIPGGVLVATNPQDAPTCQAQCISNARCFSYDLNSNFDCYLITDYNNIVDGVPGENHYHREPVCNSATYKDCNYFATGTKTPSAIYRTSGPLNKGRQECFDSCVDSNTCSGLAFDHAANTCSLYSKTAVWTADILVDSGNANLEAYEFKGCTSVGTTATSTAGGCVNTWEAVADTHAPGGMEQNDINTADDCKQKCIDTPDCVGVDVDAVRVPLCYLHLNKADLDQSAPLTGVTLYKLTRCSSTGTTAGSGGTTTDGGSLTSTTISPSAGACSNDYKFYGGKKIAGGVLVGGSVNTVDACKTWCDQRPTCAGFDFNKNDNTCWSLQKTSPIEVATDGADHYAKSVKCGDCAYDVFPGQKVNLVTGSTSTKQSAYDCLNACNADSTCQSVTYAKDNTCTFFTAKYSSNLVATVDVTYYEQYKCQCTPTYKYTKATKSKVSGGLFFQAATTEVACRTQCSSDNNCIGYDFNGQKQCWITAATNKNPIVSAPNEIVDHYTKYAECGDCRYDIIGASKVTAVNGLLQSNINTWKDCIGACATPTCQSVDFNTKTNQCYHFSAKYDTGLATDNDVLHFVQTCVKKCIAVYKYDVAKKSKVIGGLLASSGVTLDQCQVRCDNDKTCIGFDFTSAGDCWLTPATNKNGIVSSGAEAVDHYSKYAECGDCRYDVIGASKVTAATGTLQTDVTTWKDCISSCTTATTACQSVDFNTKTSQCYHFSAAYDTGLATDVDVLHFVQKCSTVSTTSSSISTTAISTTATSTGQVTSATQSSGNSCPLSYDDYPGEKVLGLQLVPNKADVSQCRAACDSDTQCVGFDYNANAPSALACWMQKNSSKPRTAQAPGEQVTHYEQKRTCGGCVFRPNSDTVPQAYSTGQAVTSEEGCVASCSTTSSCTMSFYKLGVCYLSGGPTKIFEAGTKTWEKIGTCGTTQTSCSTIYLKYSNKHVIGGTFIPGVTDSPACRSACDQDQACVGYDITTDGQCWLTKDALAQREPLTQGSGVDHYMKVISCGGVCYRQVMDASYPTSTSYGEQTLDSCLLSCSSTSQSCRDVIYREQVTQDKCRFVMSASPINIKTDLVASTGETFYSRLSSCNDEATQVTMATGSATTTTRAPELSTTVSRTAANANAGDDGRALETTETPSDA